MRRYKGNMNGERYCANKSPSKKEVHDLDNEKTGANECQIDEIIKAGNDKPYNSLSDAHAAGYVDCGNILPGSAR